MLRVVKREPANLLRLPFWLADGRAGSKAKVALHADLRAEILPYRASLIGYLIRERESSRQIVLATAAHCSIAERVSAHLDLFDRVIATSGDMNLMGAAKLACIREQIGDDFVYAGDCKALCDDRCRSACPTPLKLAALQSVSYIEV
ncbi:hypothetical protein [Burkholderia sp. MSMB1835]|uniref:hypothetical protein n=1 Tax=Burkholderia sp. MSMB1835 TaxID=1637876 RepID=UPI00211D8FE1|nr:hypothetical protein [Burkholderia sp. MSMB1835]